jgi:hypothetical protein
LLRAEHAAECGLTGCEVVHRAALAQHRIAQHQRDAAGFAGGNPRGADRNDHVMHAARANPFLQQNVDLVGQRPALKVAGEARLLLQFGAADQVQQRVPLRVAGGTDQHPPVGRAIDVPGRAERMPAALAEVVRAGQFQQRQMHAKLVCRDLDQAKVDQLADAVTPAHKQRRENRRGGHHRGT